MEGGKGERTCVGFNDLFKRILNYHYLHRDNSLIHLKTRATLLWATVCRRHEP